MPALDAKPVGAPIWLDLSTSDLDRAADFYGKLFGWTVIKGDPEEFGGYSTAMLGDSRIAGIMPKMGDPEAAAMPDAWTIYFHTTDATTTSAKISANGGQVILEPMAVGDHGTMALYVDPSGAFFGTWQPDQHDGFQAFGKPGAPSWFELMTLNYPAATAFYPTVLGVDVADMTGTEQMGEMTYATLSVGGQEYAGIADAAGQLPEGVPSHWTVTIGVSDTDATVTQLQDLGGTVLDGPSDSPFGKYAVVTDPFGAVFSVISVGQDQSAAG